MVGLSPLRNPCQVVVSRDTVIGTESLHDRFPFPAMRPDIFQAIDEIADIVRHFMRYGGVVIVLEIFREDMRVVTDLASFAGKKSVSGAGDTIHARGSSLQVEADIDVRRVYGEQLPGQFDVMPGMVDDLLLPVLVKWLDDCRLYSYRSGEGAEAGLLSREAEFELRGFC